MTNPDAQLRDISGMSEAEAKEAREFGTRMADLWSTDPESAVRQTLAQLQQVGPVPADVVEQLASCDSFSTFVQILAVGAVASATADPDSLNVHQLARLILEEDAAEQLKPGGQFESAED